MSKCKHTECYWWNYCDYRYPICKQFKLPYDCEINHCYWYDGMCHGVKKPQGEIKK